MGSNPARSWALFTLLYPISCATLLIFLLVKSLAWHGENLTARIEKTSLHIIWSFSMVFRFMSVTSGAELASNGRELMVHFQTHGTPIMIGNFKILLLGSSSIDNFASLSIWFMPINFNSWYDLANQVSYYILFLPCWSQRFHNRRSI